ncbi:hypothetical protein [Sulfobacillus thermosulfidooxidans]|nr:hypothetical protein [Sulfobacillus thermosulfidooxidans]
MTLTLKQIFQKTLYQMWGAIVVGIFIFGLADVLIFRGWRPL